MSMPLPWVPQPRFPWPVPHPQPVPGPGPQPGPQITVPDDPLGQVGATGTVGVVGQVGAAGAPASTASSSPAGPQQVGDWKQFLIWIAALAALWLILTAAQDAGYPGFANGMAGLILFGAILALGPKAIDGARQIFQ